jgi:LAO/AO transport system kinase
VPLPGRDTDGLKSVAQRRRLSAAQYIDGVLSSDRVKLAQAITVIESELESDVALAEEILDGVLNCARHDAARRVGITGTPGAGKSTFIDALGLYLIRERGEPVAVLTVDPSSPLSGGSILGDKTRMEKLSAEDRAFIRPSPSRGHLGGVARHTRETMLLCEAAGYRNVLVETVGVGQSETAVRSMTDFFLLLMIPRAGDELQGIKRGIIELIDAIAINKADGDNLAAAQLSQGEYRSALHLFPAAADGWSPQVMLCSALYNDGIAEFWEMVLRHREQQESNGVFAERRRRQSLDWMRELVASGLEDLFRQDPAVEAQLRPTSEAVREGHLSPLHAARKLLSLFVGQASAGPGRK